MCLAMAESGANIVSIYPPGDPGQPRLEETIRSSVVGGSRKVVGFECDISDSQSLRDTFDKIWRTGVVPDILLNCAGLNRRGPIEEMTDEKIDLVRFVGAMPLQKSSWNGPVGTWLLITGG